MITTRIQVTDYVAEWACAKFWDSGAQAVRFPHDTDLYHLVYDLLLKRPVNASPCDTGNLPIALPDRRKGDCPLGKNPDTYNYLSPRAASVIDARLRVMFWAECHEWMDENKHLAGVDYNDTAYMIITRYHLTRITDDAIKKNYQRWRDKLRRTKKRGYSVKSR